MIRKVLHLRSSGGMLGAESVIIEIAKHSARFGYQSIVGAIKNENDPVPEFMRVANDHHIEAVLFEGRKSLDLSLIRRIKKYIKQEQIDIVHCHGYKEDFYGVFAAADIPKVATNHLWKRTTTKSSIYALLDALLLRFFDQVFGVSDEIVQEMSRLHIKNPVKIANGVDLKRFMNIVPPPSLYQELNIKTNQRILGMISSLTPEKGHGVAIQAIQNIVREYPHVKLLIIGDGILGVELQQQVKEQGLNDHVVFLGKRMDIPDILSIIDIFLLPSYKEGLPMALLEAMAAGKAVIASRVGENAQVVIPHKTGMLIEAGDVGQLKSAIMELLLDKKLIQMLGQNARIKIKEQYSSEKMAEDYCDNYSKCIKPIKYK